MTDKDIESLGWIKHYNMDCHHMELYKNDFRELYLIRRNGLTCIQGDKETFFKGKISDKKELFKLMQQIGIL